MSLRDNPETMKKEFVTCTVTVARYGFRPFICDALKLAPQSVPGCRHEPEIIAMAE